MSVKKKDLMICFVFIVFSYLSFGQKLVIKSGDVSFLKNVHFFNTFFVSDSLIIFDKSENKWIKENLRFKDSILFGTGLIWEKKWRDNRETTFEISLEESLNNNLQKCSIASFDKQEQTHYIIVVIFKKIYTEGGESAFSKTKNILADFEVNITSKCDMSKPLLCLSIKKIYCGTSQGNFADDCFPLINNAFIDCGRILGRFISKKI